MRSQKIREEAECGSREIHGGRTEREFITAYRCCRGNFMRVCSCVSLKSASIPLKIKLRPEMTLMNRSSA